MIRRFIAISVALLLATTVAEAQQPAVKARIAGLEGNTEYMSLLEQDARLQFREDSISAAIIRVRGQLREDPENRATYSREILQAENAIFELRRAKGRIIDRINTIEQDWVLSNLNAEISRQEQNATPNETPDSLKSRNLIDNQPFRQHLTRQDYNALRRANRSEMTAVDLVNRYLSNYVTLGELAASYAEVPTEHESIEVLGRMEEVERENSHLSDSLATVWNEIFDNKSYAYDYLMEALREEKQLDRQQERLSNTMREIGSLQGATVSDALVDYFLRKQALVAYESDVAAILKLDAARDSLRGVEAQLSSIGFKLPPIKVEERYFIQYDSLQFSAKPVYTATNPIPACTIYQRGTIYRVLLGTFSTKRPVSTFRGASPICYQQTDDLKWRYFAGGFATLEEAEEAQALLKKRGFLRPEVVVWIDGVYRNLAEEPLPTSTRAGFRVEFNTKKPLADGVRTLVADDESSIAISRIGSERYIIGTFSQRSEAERFADQLRATDPTLSPEVVDIEP